MSSSKFNLNSFFGFGDDEEIEEGEEMVDTPRKNVVPIEGYKQKNDSELIIVEPSGFEDARKIAKMLLDNQAVIINFKNLDPKETIRILDFTNGVCFSISGKISRVGDDIFVAVPNNFDLQGEIKSIN